MQRKDMVFNHPEWEGSGSRLSSLSASGSRGGARVVGQAFILRTGFNRCCPEAGLNAPRRLKPAPPRLPHHARMLPD